MGKRPLRALSSASFSPRDPELSAAERATALVAQVPAAFDVTVFAAADALFTPVLAGPADSVLDTSGLSEPMGREVAWWMATCHASGCRRLDVRAWRAWIEVAAAACQSERVASFAERDLERWLKWWLSGL